MRLYAVRFRGASARYEAEATEAEDVLETRPGIAGPAERVVGQGAGDHDTRGHLRTMQTKVSVLYHPERATASSAGCRNVSTLHIT